MATKKLLYLISPLSHDDPKVMRQRFKDVCQTAAYIFKLGQDYVFSPIAHTYPIFEAGLEIPLGELPYDFKFWGGFNKEMIRRCDEVRVLTLDGWQESEGVQAEIKYAKSIGKVVKFIPVWNNINPAHYRKEKNNET